jgi:hypothetical protein
MLSQPIETLICFENISKMLKNVALNSLYVPQVERHISLG